MNVIRRFIKTVPPWAFVLVLIVLFVQSANMFYNARMPISGERENLYGGHWIIDYVKPGAPVDKAGIKIGDTIVSCNAYTIEEWYPVSFGSKAGDTLIFGMLRNNVEVGYPVINISRLSMFPGIYWSAFIFFILVSICGLYILFKKPKNKAAILYFIYIQGFALMAIGGFYIRPDPVSLFISLAFLFSGTIMPILLIHFHLVFPKPAKFFTRFKRILLIIYIAGFFVFLIQAGCQFYQLYIGSVFDPFPFDYTYLGICWGAIASVIAIAVAIFQLVTVKDTLSRNQLRIIVIGTILGSLFAIFYSFFYFYVDELWIIYPNLVQFIMRASGLILTICLLIAIFRFRIWEIEVILKKAVLYLGATLVIILSYLFLLYMVDLLTIDETKTTRFIILAVSVIIFLVSRDWLQRLIERIFHRETYDSASVVSDFEEKLAGVFRIEDLGSNIMKGLDDIFHFGSFVLILKKGGMIYETTFLKGIDELVFQKELEINSEFERKLGNSRVFSPGELSEKPPVFEVIKGELIIPLLKDNQPFGFFICGPKKSEKTYSMQDIRVLSLLARRVVALFHTASLYQKDLDRQLMLERERARISQDMHDDIGAGLTKIAMISEAGTSSQQSAVSSQQRGVRRKKLEERGRESESESGERLMKVATTARDMINRLNIIVWALNPRYDNLDSLISYARRYFGEYLENFDIGFRMEVPDEFPDFPVTPDFRRNAFYAWQEAVHNAVKHSKCSEVKIEVKINNKNLLVTIADNGKGFDRAKTGSGGNGLLNMKKRAEELGGTFEIESAPGKGTRVLFTIRLKENSIKA